MGDEMAVDCPQAACGAALLRHLRARPSAVAVTVASTRLQSSAGMH